MSQISRLLPLLLMGCATPHDAEVTGTYTTWLSANYSATVAEGKLDLASAEQFDCSADTELGWSKSTCNAEFFRWIDDDPYYVMTGDLETWREEAIFTSEGDLQLTFHVDIGDGQDFRVAWSIDPDFGPTECSQNDAGEAELVQIDGSDWIEEWSADEQSYIFYLNAGAYQVNPYDSEEEWILPEEWLSGFAKAKYAAEEFNSHPSDFGIGSSAFYTFVDPETLDYTAFDEMVDGLSGSLEGWASELTELGHVPETEIKLEDNKWRPVDNSSAGLDSWVQLDSSWVRLDSRDLAIGDSVSGDFQIYFDGIESGSRLFVQGSFNIEEIREDKWGYGVLQEELEEANNTPTCE